MFFEEKTMKSEKIYEGRILNLRIDTVELPDKKYSKREIVEHPGAVAIVPITKNNEVVLVKQYRKAVESKLLELPAGKLEIGEDPRACAIRELKEETGIKANELEFLFEFYTSPGFCNEKIYLFLARELEEGDATPAEDEYIETEKIDIEKLIAMIGNGEIADAKTIVGLLVTYNMIKGEING